MRDLRDPVVGDPLLALDDVAPAVERLFVDGAKEAAVELCGRKGDEKGEKSLRYESAEKERIDR